MNRNQPYENAKIGIITVSTSRLHISFCTNSIHLNARSYSTKFDEEYIKIDSKASIQVSRDSAPGRRRESLQWRALLCVATQPRCLQTISLLLRF